MRCGNKSPASALKVLAFGAVAAAAMAVGAENPYQGIVERNVFDLKPPPPPPSNEPPKPPTPKITLNGITTILGLKQAFLTVQVPPKPGEPAKPQPLILSEHEREGEVEVLEIDDVENTIKVNDYGEVMTIAMEKPKDSPKPTGQTGFAGFNPPGNPGAPQARSIYPPQPPTMPGAYAQPGAAPGTYPPPGAAPGIPGTYPPATASPYPGVAPGMKTLPTRTLRLPQSGAAPPMPGSSAPQQ